MCDSPFTAYVRDVPTVRTKKEIALFACLECSSFWNPSGYRESGEQLQSDVEWGVSVEQRNRLGAERLFATLEERGVSFDSVAEIGCGIGTVLGVAQDQGKEVIGFDVNRYAVRHAVDVNGLPVHAEQWTSRTATVPIDLYLCISVLEHLEEPRALVRDLCVAAALHRAALFISVPFFERSKWDFLIDPEPTRPETPFFDNDVHVTHFTINGLTRVLQEFGQNDIELVRDSLWPGLLSWPVSRDELSMTPASGRSVPNVPQ